MADWDTVAISPLPILGLRQVSKSDFPLLQSVSLWSHCPGVREIRAGGTLAPHLTLPGLCALLRLCSCPKHSTARRPLHHAGLIWSAKRGKAETRHTCIGITRVIHGETFLGSVSLKMPLKKWVNNLQQGNYGAFVRSWVMACSTQSRTQ